VPADELTDPEDADSPDELAEVELVVEELEVVLDDVEPGMVAALTYPRAPTPATDTTATPAVRRFMSCCARFRAEIIDWTVAGWFMPSSCPSALKRF